LLQCATDQIGLKLKNKITNFSLQTIIKLNVFGKINDFRNMRFLIQILQCSNRKILMIAKSQKQKQINLEMKKKVRLKTQRKARVQKPH